MKLTGVAISARPAAASVVRRHRLLLGGSAVAAVTAVVVDAVLRSMGSQPQPLTRVFAALFAALAAAALSAALWERSDRDPSRRVPLRVLSIAGGLLAGGMAVGYLATATAPGPFDPRVEIIPMLVTLGAAGWALLTLCWPYGLTALDRRTAMLDSIVAVVALFILWWQLVLPAWVHSPEFTAWQAVDSIALAVGIAVLAVLAIVSRRNGALPLAQLGLLVGGLFVFMLTDLLGQVIEGADDVTSITYSIVGYVVGVAMCTEFAHRPAVEVQTDQDRRGREIVAAAVPTALALPAGAVVIALAAPVLTTWLGGVTLVAWAALLAAVLLSRVSAAFEVRRVHEGALSALLADRTREAWFRALVGDSTEGVLVVDVSGTVIYTSPRVETDFELVRNGAGQIQLSDLIFDSSPSEVRLLLAQVAVDPSQTGPYDVIARGKDGRKVEVEAIVRAVADVGFDGYVITTRDVSDTRRLARQLASSRRRDELTGLLSREAFLAELSTALDSADELHQVAIVVIDLERFGELNDGLGHERGNQILAAVARSFSLLPDDVRVVARHGSDAFSWLIVAADPERAVGEAVDQCRQDLRGLLLEDGHEVELAFRAGYTISDHLHQRTPERNLEAAELALARSRASRHALLVEYRSEMRAETERRLVAERSLRRAISDGRIEVWYQPVLRLSDGHVYGAEALARLRMEDGDVVLPQDFIPLAEELGLIAELGRAILLNACLDTAAASVAVGRPLHVAVNVASDQLTDQLIEEVRTALALSHLEPNRLTLEITESSLADTSTRTQVVLRRLRATGVTVSLDDFGTGYSSMSYLATLPVDGLKIDRSFVTVMGSSVEGLTLARLVVQLGAALDLATVAEGIETVEQADLLRGMGCDLGQGFLFARPMPLGDYVDYVRGPVPAVELLAP